MKKYLLLFLVSLNAHAAPATIFGLPYDGTTTQHPVNVNSSGQLSITKLAGEDQTLDQMRVSMAGDSVNISSATSTEAKDAAGELVGFYVNSTSSGTIAFYDDGDGTCSSGAKTGTITPAVGWHPLPIKFATAICVLTASTINVTVVYR